jgi:hypothetical protein
MRKEAYMMDTRLIIGKHDMTMVNLPIIFVIIAAFIAPRLAVLSAVLALVTGCTVRIERNPEEHSAPFFSAGSDDRRM